MQHIDVIQRIPSQRFCASAQNTRRLALTQTIRFPWQMLSLAVLTVTVCWSPLAAAQQEGGGSSQTPRAVQLPPSGRSMESSGQISTRQISSPVGVSVVQPTVVVTGNYQGSISSPQTTQGPYRLSLVEAVKRGLQFNLGVIALDVVSATVRAQRMQALSQVLPQITASAGETVEQTNLASVGFNTVFDKLGSGANAIPAVIGPFQYVQAQGNFKWDALSLTNIRNVQAADAVAHAARLNEQDARELVVLAVGGSYLQVVAAAARIDAQRLQVKYAQATYDRARAQLSAGTNTRVDLTRSLVQLLSEKERLLSYQGDYEQKKLAFARLIGLPQNAEIIFTESLDSKNLPPVDEAEELRTALEHRPDLLAAEAQRDAARRILSGAREERLPSLSFNGYYGVSGVHPDNSHGNFMVQGTVNIPVFDGGRISGDIAQARATLQQRQAEYEDMKEKVEQDVRDALIQLRVAAGQVRLAESNRQYSRETLAQSQDRFEAGVTNTVEVVQAEQQEATAENDYISSLFAWNLARLSLARATGDAEADLANLFPGAKH